MYCQLTPVFFIPLFLAVGGVTVLLLADGGRRAVPPMLWIPNQLEGARRGESATLQCNTEAFPRSINYWTNHRGEMIAASEYYVDV